jgi:hypothetical protein
MSRRTAGRIAWGLWTVDLAVVVGLLPGGTGSGDGGAISGALFILVFATTGALVASRIPDNPIGWLLCSAALAFSVGGVCVTITDEAVRAGWHGPAVTVAAWVGSFVWMLGVVPAATFVLLLFPDGRLPSRRWAPVAWLSGASLAAITVGIAFSPGPIEDTPVSNPLGIPGGKGALAAVEATGLAVLFCCILASCASLVSRYRHAESRQRQQLKWLAWSLPLVLGWLGASVWVESRLTGDKAVDVANTLSSVGLTIVPVTIAIAILRHRLYDIDVVINRTLVYGSLSATLLAVYLGSVLLLQLVLGPLTDRSDLAVAASTLAVAALVRPARRRIQGAVDRRFYRRRYDAERTLESFGGRLRQEVDLESVCADLRGVVRDTVQPVHVSLWLRP